MLSLSVMKNGCSVIVLIMLLISRYVVDIAVGVICGMVFYIEAYGVFTHHLVFA